MNTKLALAAGVALAVIAGVGTAHAGGHGGRMLYRPPHALPPVAGTIHMSPGGFGRGGYPGGPGLHPGFAQGGWTAGAQVRRPLPAGHGYGPPMGYQGHAFTQLNAGSYRFHGGSTYGYAGAPYERGRYGSGLIGALGAGTVGYNLADSAVAGSTYGLTGSGYGYGYGPPAVAEAPVQVSYGEPSLWSGGYGGGYYNVGYAETGSPGRVPYYNAGSGNPAGGLGAYSSGAFSPGPKIIVISQQNVARVRPEACSCGPRIVHVPRYHRYSSW